MNNSVLPVSIPDAKQLEPYHDRITVIPDPMPKFTQLGLYIPDTVKDKPYSGTVMKVGKRCQQAVVGLRVIFGKYSGTELTINDEKFLLMREADLILDLDTMTPFADRVLITPEHKSKILASGLIVPDNVQEQPQVGFVDSVGSQCHEVKTGGRVLFGKFAGMQISIRENDYIVMREADVVGIV